MRSFVMPASPEEFLTEARTNFAGIVSECALPAWLSTRPYELGIVDSMAPLPKQNDDDHLLSNTRLRSCCFLADQSTFQVDMNCIWPPEYLKDGVQKSLIFWDLAIGLCMF